MADDEWIDCMNSVEPNLLEVNLSCRSRSFLTPDESTREHDDVGWSVTHRHPAWTSSKLVLETAHPFATMDIRDAAELDTLQARQACDICHKSRKFFCYTCHVPLPATRGVIPRVQLPVRIDIVKHPGEVEGKSTAVHARLVAPEQVTIHIYPDIPDYTQEKALLVFPGPRSKHLDQYQRHLATEPTPGQAAPPFPYNKIVFIDSTWNQCHKICQDYRIQSLPQVIIQSRQTLFWRYQSGKPKEYLSTIEAIYYLCVDFHRIILNSKYNGEYDNLLYFFKFMYEKIHQLYKN